LSKEYQRVGQFLRDISFGERQLVQFVCDRPETAEIIKRESMLRHMLVWRFAGGLTGKRMYWDCNDPSHSKQADHTAYFNLPVMVRVAENKNASGIDKLTYLLFELLNYRIDEEYVRLLNASVEDRITREEFAERCIRAECEASKKTRLFFLLNPIQGANFKSDPDYYATVNSSESVSEHVQWLKGRNRSEYDPLKYYGVAYEQILKIKKYNDEN
jgi:hypothetical protein